MKAYLKFLAPALLLTACHTAEPVGVASGAGGGAIVDAGSDAAVAPDPLVGCEACSGWECAYLYDWYTAHCVSWPGPATMLLCPERTPSFDTPQCATYECRKVAIDAQGFSFEFPCVMCCPY